MNKFLQALAFNSFGSANSSPMFPLFEDLEVQRQHYTQRKKEIEEIIHLLSLRVEAENIYAQYLYRVSSSQFGNPNPDTGTLQAGSGLLAREVQCFKEDCHAKARAAEELAENVAQDCVAGLQRLIDE